MNWRAIGNAPGLLGPDDDYDLPEVPEWLESELRANVVFVQEAIENGDVCADLAAAWMGGGNYADVIERAISAWVEHVWKRSDYDAPLVQRVWAEMERDCARRDAA